MHMWKALLSSLSEVQCPAQLQLDNGQFWPRKEWFRPGETQEFLCNHGYTLYGSALRSCTALGQWTGILPICDDRSKRTSLYKCLHIYGHSQHSRINLSLKIPHLSLLSGSSYLNCQNALIYLHPNYHLSSSGRLCKPRHPPRSSKFWTPVPGRRNSPVPLSSGPGSFGFS